MSDVVSFGDNFICSAAGGNMNRLFNAIRTSASDNVELSRFLEQQTYFDAIGGWFFDDLSRQSLATVLKVVEQEQLRYPDSLVDCVPIFRPRYFENLRDIREKLLQRIAQLPT